MPDVRWHPQAIKDLEAIESYYLDVAPECASVLVNSILHERKR